VTTNPHLDDALAVFAELGWADADPGDVLELPLGTPEQRRAALAGLGTGDWESHRPRDWAGHDTSFVEMGGRRVQAQVVLRDCRETMLVLFAVRLGVDGRRAAKMLAGASLDFALRRGPLGDTLRSAVGAVVEQRGPQFAQAFLTRALAEESWWWSYPTVLVGLVGRWGLAVPRRLSYLEAWLVTVTEVMSGRLGERGGLAVSGADRFTEHMHAAVAARLGADALVPVMVGGVERGWLARDEAVDLFSRLVTAQVSRPEPTLGKVLADAIARGWLERDAAADLVMVGLSFAARPLVRAMWLTAWFDDLDATDADVVACADALVPVLATGDKRVIEHLAPILIAGVPDQRLPAVAAAALTAPTKKALRVVLGALAARPRPADAVVALITPHLTALDIASDRRLARAVAQVLDRWAPLPRQPTAPS